MNIILQSFGFKHGYPEADIVLDVRFLPNPYWVTELQPLNGTEPQVALYVLNNDRGRALLKHLELFLSFLIDEHQAREREELTIAIGCTGGKHRSVAVTEHLRSFFGDRDYSFTTHHRDVEKD